MPRRAKTKTGRVGPYDLTTIKLPGGTEMEALGVGFLHQKTTETLRAGYRRGYAVAATKANTHVLQDTNAAWVLADSKTGLLRAQTAQQLFEGPYGAEMVEAFTPENATHNIGPTNFAKGHAWKRELGLQKNNPLTGPLKDLGKHYVKLNDTVFLHHRAEALPPEVIETPRRAPRQPEPQQAIMWSPGDYAANFMGW